MSVRVEVRPALLEWARARSGIDEGDWQRRFPVFDSWRSGAGAPTLKQLEDFARKTYTPVGFFFLDEPPVETVPIPDFRTMAEGSMASTGVAASANLLDVVYACQARQEWYRDHQLLNGETPLEFVGSVRTSDAPKDSAGRICELLDWTSESRGKCRDVEAAMTWLREHAEAAGVLVMVSGIVNSDTHRVLDPLEFRGFALADRYAAAVFVNASDSKAGQVFTLIHEVAHLLLGETALSDIAAESTRNNAVERWCNQVAAEVLVPMDEFRARFEQGAELVPQLRPLAEYFRVSSQVILGRAREAGVFGWDRYLALLQAERARAAGSPGRASGGGNYYNTKPVQVSKRFARAVVASALEGRTPYPQAFRLLGLKKASTFDQLVVKLGVLA